MGRLGECQPPGLPLHGRMIIPPHILRMLERLRATVTERDARERLKRRVETMAPPVRPVRQASAESIASLWRRIEASGPISGRETIADPATLARAAEYSGNIE